MQNYTGFTTIDVGGRVRPFYYGTMAARIYNEWKGGEFHDFVTEVKKAFGVVDIKEGESKEEWSERAKNSYNPYLAADVVYACLAAGCRYSTHIMKEPETQDFDPETVTFWIDTMSGEQWKAAGMAIAGANTSPNAPPQEKKTRKK